MAVTDILRAAPHWVRRWRWAEFVGFYLALPVAVAVLLPPDALFTVLLAVTLLGAVLLHFTPGFRWAELTRGWGRIDWRLVAGFSAVTAAVAMGILLLVRPGALFFLPRWMPELTLAILLFYPVLSALPQEVVFRPLFFRRYGALFPDPRVALVLNAAIFSLAHLMFWSWIVAALTFAGGLVFAWAYERRGSFALAVVLHAVAGNILFLVGLGNFFYSGNVARPF